MLDGGGGDFRRLQSLAECLAPTDEALVGGHLHDRGAPARDPALRERERLLERRAQDVDVNLGYLHRSIIGTMPVRTEINEGLVPVKIYTGELEPAARLQLVNISKLSIVHHHVAAMPDVHLGIGATVGSVIPTKSAIIPAAVGVDIGCGMMAARLSLTASDIDERSLQKVFGQISRDVPVGFGQHHERDARTGAAKRFGKGLARIMEKHPGIG